MRVRIAVSKIEKVDGGIDRFYYDNNGNMVRDTTDSGGRDLIYSSFDKPTRITKGKPPD